MEPLPTREASRVRPPARVWSPAPLPSLDGRAPRALQRPRTPWTVLGLGAFLAPAFGLLPVLRYMGWFLSSLVHETGHCVAAWVCGMPAYPAIRIDGHAAALHSTQKPLLVALVWASLAALTWQLRRRPRARLVAAAAVLLYPLLALTSFRDLLHLLAGHLGELAFAGVFFYRALSGGFTDSVPERVAYATCAFFLAGHNVVLDLGLVTDEGARQAYAGNGSFGLTQDLIRAARHVRGSLEGMAGVMLVLSLAALPLAAWIWRLAESRPSPGRLPRR